MHTETQETNIARVAGKLSQGFQDNGAFTAEVLPNDDGTMLVKATHKGKNLTHSSKVEDDPETNGTKVGTATFPNGETPSKNKIKLIVSIAAYALK